VDSLASSRLKVHFRSGLPFDKLLLTLCHGVIEVDLRGGVLAGSWNGKQND
jgi:dUTPase